jgi:plastocyanin
VIGRAVLSIAAVAAALAAAAGPATAGKVATVELGTSYYAPAKVTLKKGDKVRLAWIHRRMSGFRPVLDEE